MSQAFLNRIGTAVPPHDVHAKFLDFARTLVPDSKRLQLLERMIERSDIEHRYSFLEPASEPEGTDTEGFYQRGAFPGTGERMARYERDALSLARAAIEDLGIDPAAEGVTHLLVTSCTGFYAPGLDVEIVAHYGLDSSVERTIVGFMGCYAAMNALKLARHIVRSDAGAKVLIVNLELCTLHLQETGDLDQILCFLLFSDGCAASLVSAAPEGFELLRFRSALLPDSGDQMSWRIGGLGFDMRLAGAVPGTIAAGLPAALPALLDGRSAEEVELWAVHPGGRSVLDAIERGLRLNQGSLNHSRAVLRAFGNMSSPTVMFVLQRMLRAGAAGLGCAMAFGPGLTAETMLFQGAA